MNEKYFLAIGGGLIIISFIIVTYFGIISTLNIEPKPLNETLTFEQLEELNYESREKILENPHLEQFRDLVEKRIGEVKERIIISDSTNKTKP